MKEVLPGVYQITLTLSGFNPGSINIYLIRDIEGYALFDTGWDMPAAVTSMAEQLASSGILYTDIKRVFVTHCHVDHLGMIGRLKRSHQAVISLHENEIELIKLRFNDGDQFIPMTDSFLLTHGVPQSELTPPEFQIPAIPDLTEPDILLKGGEEIAVGEYCLKVINTPGHTPGHISFYEPRCKFIISGDVLLPTIATNAAFHVQHIQNPLRKYLNSILALKEMDIEMVLPGHEYIFSHHRQRIDELVLHHHKKDEGIRKAFASGQARTAYEVSQELFWSLKARNLAFPQLSGWDKRFAVLQTIAHLEEWTSELRLSRFVSGGVFFYQPSSNKGLNS
jgi:glyoxylase-like metal-dependent hydrolase (beta-lactamase superfamily II)